MNDCFMRDEGKQQAWRAAHESPTAFRELREALLRMKSRDWVDHPRLDDLQLIINFAAITLSMIEQGVPFLAEKTEEGYRFFSCDGRLVQEIWLHVDESIDVPGPDDILNKE